MNLVEIIRKSKLAPILSVRFVKFCTVGFSGIFVNLGFLLVFADIFSIHQNIASALAIEVATISNFAINELWTFSDKRSGAANGIWIRGLRFHLVSLGGGILQWSIFVTFNMVWFLSLSDASVIQEFFSGSDNAWLLKPITDPPDVGNWKLVSQLIGIGVATFWNFLMNFYWTWREK